MKKSQKSLSDKLGDIIIKNIGTQNAIAGEVRALVTDIDSESLQLEVADINKSLQGPGWGSAKSATAGVLSTLKQILKEREEA